MLFIDVTNTINNPNTTGIQRVVKNLYLHAKTHKKYENIEFIEYEGLRGKYYIIDKRDPRLLGVGFNPLAEFNESLLYKVLRASLSYRQKNRLISIVLSFRSIFLRRTRHELSPEKPVYIEERGRLSLSQKIYVGRGDSFLLADSTWNYDPWLVIKSFRQRGALIVHIIYDLLPLDYPNFFDKRLVQSFNIWHIAVNYYVDHIYCISNTVKKRFQQCLRDGNVSSVKHCHVFQLGSDFVSEKSKDNGYDYVERNQDSELIFISVGTIEPRKNYDYLIDVFDKLWANNNLGVVWHIVGMPGWECESVSWRIQNHPLLGENIIYHDKLDDDGLKHLYLQSDCVIIASIDEGYGLPIVEASRHNCDMLVADIEVFREFDLKEDSYFSIDDGGEDILAKVSQYIQDAKGRRENRYKKEIKVIEWKEAVTNVLDSVSALT